MTPQEIEIVQSTFALVRSSAEQVAETFYGRLFETAPGVRTFFPDDLKPQGRKLMTMLATVVDGLENLGDLVPAVQDLGRRHIGYGTLPEHYDAVGAALLWTLEQGLGDAWTPEAKDGWTTAYTTLATVMKDAAEAASKAA